METLSSLNQPLGEKSGEHKLTTETASLNDGDTVTFPGTIVDSWATSNVADHNAVVTGESGADATVAVKEADTNSAAGSAQSVTVFAIHE